MLKTVICRHSPKEVAKTVHQGTSLSFFNPTHHLTIRATACCGQYELVNIQSKYWLQHVPELLAHIAYQRLHHGKWGSAIFTQRMNKGPQPGETLTRLIINSDFGGVMADDFYNPNEKSTVRAYTWLMTLKEQDRLNQWVKTCVFPNSGDFSHGQLPAPTTMVA